MNKKLTIPAWLVMAVAVVMGAWLVFAGVQVKDTAGGLFIGLNASDLIGFHGSTPVTQAVLSAASGGTNSFVGATNVLVTTTTPAAVVTNVAKQTAEITYLGPGLTTNTVTVVTNEVVQSVTVAQLVTNVVAQTATNSASGTLANEIRALLIQKGLAQ